MTKNPYKENITRFSTHNIILQNIGNNKVVLDIGCNDGYIGRNSDPSNHFFGLDYLQESVNERYQPRGKPRTHSSAASGGVLDPKGK